MDLSSIEALKAKALRVKARRARTKAEQRKRCKQCGLNAGYPLCAACRRVNEIMEADRMAQKKKGPGTLDAPEGKLFLLLPRRKNAAKPVEVPKPKLEGRAPRARDDEEV